MKKFITALVSLFFAFAAGGSAIGAAESPDINSCWRFSLCPDGIPADLAELGDSSWSIVSLPHDWGVDGQHGCYRRHFSVPASDKGRIYTVYVEHVSDSYEFYCNGTLLGRQVNGYIPAVFNLSDYLEYGGENVITILCNAGTVQKRYYEGSGIVRGLRFFNDNPVHVRILDGVRPRITVADDLRSVSVAVSSTVVNADTEARGPFELRQVLLNAGGREVARESRIFKISPMKELDVKIVVSLQNPLLWSPEHPNLYRLRTEIVPVGSPSTAICRRETVLGFRRPDFTADKGLVLNGSNVPVRGATLLAVHGGFGAAVPDGLWRYRLERLKEFGFNAVRVPGTPAPERMLSVCDSLGLMVVDESRVCGTSEQHLDALEAMVYSHMSHPSVVLWSLGNEDPMLENNISGEDISRKACAYIKWLDPSRETTYANAGGPFALRGVSVMGFDFIDQNAVESICASMPEKPALGLAETSGCGTRGTYSPELEKQRMVSLNRSGVQPDLCSYSDTGFDVSEDNLVLNVIERGLQFYKNHPSLGGLFFESGFDYPVYSEYSGSSENKPVLSQTGIFDACGFPKDEAWYLRSCWKKTPMVYMSPHVSFARDGILPVLVYSNCEEVEIFVGTESLGRRKMPSDSHISWNIPCESSCSYLALVGYNEGRKVASSVIKSASAPEYALWKIRKYNNLAVIDISVVDNSDNPVPDAEVELDVKLPSGWVVAGWANGNPMEEVICNTSSAVKSFAGKAQVVVKTCSGDIAPAAITEESVLVIVK